ncbi:type IV secretion system protein VirD4 [Luteibacter sp. Sphag1AF]|nr:type IV secretion system protein VirD4 [Luteibacter sp. Sphag1AF]
MNYPWKAVCAIALLLAAIVAGAYASGYLLLVVINADIPLTFRVWWDSYRDAQLPEYKHFRLKVYITGIVGFGLPLFAWVCCLMPLLKAKPRSLHGDARFAGLRDLKKSRLLAESPNGIIVGKFGRKLIRLSGQQFAILAAPTRSGKGVGVVIPNLLDYQESVVVLDIKQENFQLTSGWRKAQGQEVYLFNPFAEDGRTHRWNPLSYASPDPSLRIADIQAMAAMLYPDAGEAQKFWVNQARHAFMAFALYLYESYDREITLALPTSTHRFPTLGEIYRLSSGNGSDLRKHIETLRNSDFLSKEAKGAFNNLLSQARDTFSSIMGSFKAPLNAWINPALDAATSGNHFRLTDVRRKKMTIYIGIQPNKLAESQLIVNLFFSQLINENTRELPQNDATLKHQCLLLMDEFTSIGKIDILARAVSYMAGYNLRLLPIIQSMAQLDATYGKDISRTIITNHALQIIYAPREQNDANDYSQMLGYTTVSRDTISRGEAGPSRTRTEERRALMLPQELKALGTDKEVILYEGIAHPVRCQKIRYYQDKRFTARLLPPVEVAALTMERPMPIGKKTIAVAAVAGLAVAGLSKASTPPPAPPVPAIEATTETPPPPSASDVAEQAATRFLDFVAGLSRTADITQAAMERAFHLSLSEIRPGTYFVEQKIGAGWIYSVAYRAPRPDTKAGFAFDFYHPDRTSDPTLICVMDLERIRSALIPRGFKEWTNPRHHGGISSWNFEKEDLVVMILSRDFSTDSHGRECVLLVQTRDLK